MAVRRWAVRPEPATGMCSREAMREAFLDAEATLHVAGGVLTTVVQRAPTDVPGEMVTVGAVFEWKDRTDAKAQPEASAALFAPEPAPAPRPPEPDDDLTAAELEQHFPAAEGEPVAVGDDDLGDGLDRSTLEEEDLSSVPAELR